MPAAASSAESHHHRPDAPFLVLTDELPLPRADGTVIGIGRAGDDPVTAALAALTTALQGRWLGRAGSPDQAPQQRSRGHVAIDVQEGDLPAYHAQHGRSIWPIYHDLVAPAAYAASWRSAYRRVNLAYANAAAEHAAAGALVWVHGHQLQLVPAYLRAIRPDVQIGLFLPTAFPAPDLFHRMPMWKELLTGLLEADHLGFQTSRSAENFLQVAASTDRATPTVAVNPTSIDTTLLADLSLRATTMRQAAALRAQLGNPATLILSLGPASDTQGLEQRLRAIAALYDHGRLRSGEAVVVQIITDDAAGIPQRHDRIAQLVARINGQHAAVGRPCIHSVLDSPSLVERACLYQAADLMLATPLREATSPYALEFVATARSQSALVLSEFSGTAQSLAEAYLVNPHDHESTVDTILTALRSDPIEREHRMTQMRRYPIAYDTHTWARRFLNAMHAEADLRTRTRHALYRREVRNPLRHRRPQTRPRGQGTDGSGDLNRRPSD